MKALEALGASILVGLVLQQPAGAQVIPESAPGMVRCIEGSDEFLKEWKGLYFQGKWPELVSSMERTLALSIKEPWVFAGDNTGVAPEATIVTFPAMLLGEKEPTLVRVILDANRPFSKYLAGVQRVREIVVVPNAEASVASVYWYHDAKNPAEAGWIELVKKLPLAGISSVAAGAFRISAVDETGNRCSGVWSHFRDVSLPGVRGKIASETVVSIPSSASDYHEAAQKLNRSFQVGGARISACAQAVASRLAALMPPGTTKEGKELLLATFEAELKSKVCTDEMSGPPELVVPRSAAVQSSFDAFVGLLAPSVLKGSAEIENVPLQHWSLGVLAAAAVDESGAERAKVDSGKVVRDPLGGVLAIGAVYFHPKAFDSRTSRPTPAERWRLFVGGVFTPDPGIAAGVAFQLFRGLTVNAGFASLQVNTPKDGVNFGDTADGAQSPLHRAHRDVVFIAFGYNF